MKHVGTDKYTIAWFKLAECVARGEKERALGVYRLLAHSFDDLALVRQLEGDLLLSFNDSHAVEKYQEAAELYCKSDRFLEAAALYEHLLVLEPDIERYRLIVLDLYIKMNLSHKRVSHLMEMIKCLCTQQEWNKAIIRADEIKGIADRVRTGKAYEYIACAMIQTRTSSHQTIMHVIQEIISLWTDGNHEVSLAQFLSKLKALDEPLYEQVLEEIRR